MNTGKIIKEITDHNNRYRDPRSSNFEKIKAHAKHFILIHSDNDRYCPLAHAEYLSKQLDGELIVKFGQDHFSTDTFGEKYREFPLILDLLTSA